MPGGGKIHYHSLRLGGASDPGGGGALSERSKTLPEPGAPLESCACVAAPASLGESWLCICTDTCTGLKTSEGSARVVSLAPFAGRGRRAQRPPHGTLEAPFERIRSEATPTRSDRSRDSRQGSRNRCHEPPTHAYASGRRRRQASGSREYKTVVPRKCYNGHTGQGLGPHTRTRLSDHAGRASFEALSQAHIAAAAGLRPALAARGLIHSRLRCWHRAPCHALRPAPGSLWWLPHLTRGAPAACGLVSACTQHSVLQAAGGVARGLRIPGVAPNRCSVGAGRA